MLQNYLVTGLRALDRNRVFAAINILGLAIGMAACILLLLFVRYETSYDQWLPEHERAFQVQRYGHDPDGRGDEAVQVTAHIAGTTLKKDFPEIEALAYVSEGEPVVLQNGNASTSIVLMVDPSFLDIIQLPLVRGDRRSAMRDIHSALLTEHEAMKRFPGHDPVGQTLTMVRNGKSIDYRITGVLKDIPRNSQFHGDIIVPYDRAGIGLPDSFYTNFGWNGGYNYVRLRPGVRFADLQPRMASWEKRNIPSQDAGGVMVNEGDVSDWVMTPIADVHLGKAKMGAMTPTNDAKTIGTFTAVAILILAMACINFTNLATARAGQRAREVALRKVMGASRRQLIVQFLGESLVVAAIAMMVALAIVELALPLLSDFLKADLVLNYFGTGGILLPVVGLVLLVGVAAGLYPALVLSHFDPAPVLKSNRSGSEGMGSGWLRSALVVIQFAVSIGLVICTAVVAVQTRYARSADPGYSRAGLLQVSGIGRKQVEPVADSLVTAISQVPGVIGVGRTNLAIAGGNQSSSYYRMDGISRPLTMSTYNVDTGFFAALGLRPLAGRLLDPANPRDDVDIAAGDSPTDAEIMSIVARGANAVINTEAARKLGFANPADAVGKVVRASMVEDRFGLVPVSIVGVVPSVQMRSVRDPIEPIIYYYDRSFLSDIMVRVKVGEAGAVRDRVEAVWKRYASQVPFDAKFADDIVRAQYDADEARAKTFAAFAGLAIIVACLGLYGLAAFTAERRTREIGIRKVLGANTGDIVRLLVWQFSRPVLIANIIAWPVAWWLMRDWLDGFSNRIDLGPQWFIGAGALAAIIAAATIIGHALKVAQRSPALALRYE
ncbi:MAG: ABC transporter permease [Alphaproteobacteria bacterium PA4]|nr:MAG: ABC transporter permease [Alphaproteobacteria bacterium PA4]